MIVGAGLTTLREYLGEPRRGKARLSSYDKGTIWKICQELETILKARRAGPTWSRVRAVASKCSEQQPNRLKYDTVFIDEAQDLQPTVLRMVVNLSRSASRLFIGADPNQTIYGSGYSWSRVHSDFQFRGGNRSELLRTCYRSTLQIGEAASAFLKGAALEEEDTSLEYVNTHGCIPRYTVAKDLQEMASLLSSTIDHLTGRLSHEPAEIAVLVSSNLLGSELEEILLKYHRNIRFMDSGSVDITYPGFKILTEHSSKGLEFPVVIVVERMDIDPRTVEQSIAAELFNLQQRVSYVAMSRPFERLIVVVDDGLRHRFGDRFVEPYWQELLDEAGAVHV